MAVKCGGPPLAQASALRTVARIYRPNFAQFRKPLENAYFKTLLRRLLAGIFIARFMSSEKTVFPTEVGAIHGGKSWRCLQAGCYPYPVDGGISPACQCRTDTAKPRKFLARCGANKCRMEKIAAGWSDGRTAAHRAHFLPAYNTARPPVPLPSAPAREPQLKRRAGRRLPVTKHPCRDALTGREGPVSSADFRPGRPAAT